jgi:hypothetical protein
MRSGDAAVNAVLVLVPETAVNKNNLLHRWEHQIRLAGKVGSMKAEPKAQSMN